MSQTTRFGKVNNSNTLKEFTLTAHNLVLFLSISFNYINELKLMSTFSFEAPTT